MTLPVVSTPQQAQPSHCRQLIAAYPNLRPPVIHQLLRQGETMNVISQPKVGKRWLVTGLAISVATGQPWLGTFDTEAGNVLIIDNELHGETIANRIPKVADGMGVHLDDFQDNMRVEDLRGQLRDILSMRDYFEQLPPNEYRLIIIDALYPPCRSARTKTTTPRWRTYSTQSISTLRLGCSFVLVHHFPKGNQSRKATTDVGAGQEAQSRAVDTHSVLRPHKVDGAYVLDAAVRTWPPLASRVLRWEFPVWTPDDSLDAKALRVEGGRKSRAAAACTTPYRSPGQQRVSFRRS